MTDIIRGSVSFPQRDGLDEMLSTAIRRRAEAMRQVETFDKHIANLKRDIAERDGVKGGPELPPVTPGQYAGMRPTGAVLAYLKARPGFKIPIERVVKDLLEGGVDPGKPHSKKDPSPERNLNHKLKIILAQTTDFFRWDKDWNIELTPAATAPPKPRKKYAPRSHKSMA
jgi:hypothetical protein